jgi:hypothetical protein
VGFFLLETRAMSVEQEQVQEQQQEPVVQTEAEQLDLLPEGEQAKEEPSEQQEETDESKAARLVKEAQLRDRRERNKAAAERRVLEKERDTYRQVVERLTAQQQPPQKQEPQRSTEPTRDYNPETGKPYATYDEFIEDRAAWRAEKRAIQAFEERLKQSVEAMQQHQRQQSQTRQEQQHVQRMSEFAKQVPDFEEIAARDDVEIPQAAGHIIKQMANGPALIYAMAQRPELAQNLREMESPLEMATYLGQLSQWINSHRTSQISNAAPAGRGVGTKPASSSTPPSDPDEYERWANKRFGKR